MCRVTVCHLRVHIDHLRVTLGHSRHPLSEVTNILYLLVLVILTSFLICSHWLTQSQKEADIYYLFIIG